MSLNYRYVDSPIGRWMLAGDERGLKFIGFPQGKGQVTLDVAWQHRTDCFADAESQLSEYFEGKRCNFELLPTPGGTSFQLAVLDALQTIPFDENGTGQLVLAGRGSLMTNPGSHIR